MEKIKFVLFIEFLALFVCGAAHLLSYLTKVEFPVSCYWIVPTIILIACLLAIFVFIPILCWLYKDIDANDNVYRGRLYFLGSNAAYLKIIINKI